MSNRNVDIGFTFGSKCVTTCQCGKLLTKKDSHVVLIVINNIIIFKHDRIGNDIIFAGTVYKNFILLVKMLRKNFNITT